MSTPEAFDPYGFFKSRPDRDAVEGYIKRIKQTSQGQGIEIPTGDGSTLLHAAAKLGKSPDIVKDLLDAKAKIEARTKDGQTPCTWRQGRVNSLMW